MKKYLPHLIFLVILTTVWAFSIIPENKGNKRTSPGAGIQFFESSWPEAVNKAQRENKPIFLDAYASWCGPCKQLKRNTFTKKKAGDFFNAHFINVAIDMEKNEGPALAQKFGVDAYPTLIIADKDGNIVTYTKGYMNADQLLEFGKYGLDKFRR